MGARFGIETMPVTWDAYHLDYRKKPGYAFLESPGNFSGPENWFVFIQYQSFNNCVRRIEGRTLPNLLGCLLSRRFPVHASESWPVFFRSMVHLFGAILNDVTISLLYHSASCFAVCRTCWKVQALSFCLVLRCLSDVLEGSSFIAVWSVSYFVMLLKNFVGVIYQSLRKVCATSGPCTSTRTCFVLNGSRCLIELTRCGRKSNQPSSVAWPLCQPTRCGRKTNQPSSVAWWPLCQPTRCGRSNAAWWPLRCGLKRNELSRGVKFTLTKWNLLNSSWMFPLHVICCVLVYNYDLQTQSK